MSALELSSPATISPQKYNTAEAQGKGFTIALMNMFKILKENRIFQLIKSMKAQTLEWGKETIQGVKVEIHSKKKIQTRGKQEMKVYELEQESQRQASAAQLNRGETMQALKTW